MELMAIGKTAKDRAVMAKRGDAIAVFESIGGEEQRARLGLSAIGQNVRIEHFFDEDHGIQKVYRKP